MAGAALGREGQAEKAGPQMRSEIKPKDDVILFDTAARESADGKHWIVPIHVRVFQPEKSRARMLLAEKVVAPALGIAVPADKRPIFEDRANLMFADNERGRQVVVAIAGQRFVLPATAPNGHAQAELKLPRPDADRAARAGALEVTAILPANDPRVRRGNVMLVGRKGLSVISDIDDTVKITHVTDRRRMLETTFLDAFTTVPAMDELYRQWAAGENLSQPVSAFHFVSASPWHLYEPLRGMFAKAAFPPATMALKWVRIKDSSIANLFKSGIEMKPPVIEDLIRTYPERRFVLVGDNGEEDPEAYGIIARKYPDRIRAIYIRVLPEKPEATADPRYAKAFKDVPIERWRLFREPSEIRGMP